MRACIAQVSWINPVNLREEENPEGSGKPENHVEREAIDRLVSKETCHDPMRHEPESTDQALSVRDTQRREITQVCGKPTLRIDSTPESMDEEHGPALLAWRAPASLHRRPS